MRQGLRVPRREEQEARVRGDGERVVVEAEVAGVHGSSSRVWVVVTQGYATPVQGVVTEALAYRIRGRLQALAAGPAFVKQVLLLVPGKVPGSHAQQPQLPVRVLLQPARQERP